MKQLLIVKGTTGIDVSSPNNQAVGKIGFFKLSDYSVIAGSAAIAEDFGITLGRGTNSPVFMIPEVNFKTLAVTKILPIKGTNFVATYTVPENVSEGEIYTLVLVKKDTVTHERNTWTVTETATAKSTGSTIYASLLKQLQEQASTGSLNMTIEGTDGTRAISFTGKDEEDWELKAANDAAYDGGISITTHGCKTIGDKKYIEDLASRCAQGKGFSSVYGEGKEIYPGYPEAVEDLALNTSGYYVQTGTATPPEEGDMRKYSTAGYVVYNLRFATQRKNGKQLDELVWQYVHIAVPKGGTAESKIDTMFGIS